MAKRQSTLKKKVSKRQTRKFSKKGGKKGGRKSMKKPASKQRKIKLGGQGKIHRIVEAYLNEIKENEWISRDMTEDEAANIANNRVTQDQVTNYLKENVNSMVADIIIKDIKQKLKASNQDNGNTLLKTKNRGRDYIESNFHVTTHKDGLVISMQPDNIFGGKTEKTILKPETKFIHFRTVEQKKSDDAMTKEQKENKKIFIARGEMDEFDGAYALTYKLTNANYDDISRFVKNKDGATTFLQNVLNNFGLSEKTP